jgi:regulator of sigma E protease
MSITTILLFIIILLVLVIVHEFGHFIVAKWTGMRVDEFAFGFPPRIFGKKIGETLYAVNALPLGGYVSIWGETGNKDDHDKDGAKHHPRAFGNRPWWAQLLVLVAGVTMNMILAWIIFVAISFGKIELSVDDPEYGSRIKDAHLVVVDSAPNSPASMAGIIPGSSILSITSGRTKADLTSATTAVLFISKYIETPFQITYKDPKGQVSSTTIAGVYGILPNKKALGVSLDVQGYVKLNPLEAVIVGSQTTYHMTMMTLGGLKSLVASIKKGENVLNSLSGPVGIARIVGETSSYGVTSLFTLVALLSINLAIFNLLPLPALDGGRMVMVIFETISRKKIPFKYFSWLNIVGFFLLMLLLVVVTFNDVRR